jgi:hypothetical protein
MTIDVELQARVDAQLLEQGAFTVLEFLIDTGRLLPSDYESWRRLEISTLDDVLMGSKEKIRLQIEAAAGYAQSIGLVPQLQSFYSWVSAARDNPADPLRPSADHPGTRGESPRDSAESSHTSEPPRAATNPPRASAEPLRASVDPLRASADPRLHQLIASRYVPRQSVPQMDLFFDNPVVALTNGIVRALSDGNVGETQRQLDRLYAQAPNHADLAAFDRLLAALGHLDRPIDEPGRELDFLLELTPTAKRLLGSQARDLLAPLWRQLASTLGGRRFSVDEPALHRSFALSQSQDWPGVSDSVRRESEWWLHAPLCLRLAQSSFYQQHRIEALTAWFHLCWRAPAQAADVLDNRRQPDVGARRQPDTGVAALWQRFVDSEEDLPSPGAPSKTGARSEAGAHLETALTPADFPAWILLHEQGLALQLPVDLPTADTPAEENYRCVHRWIHARRTKRHSDEMALRKALQANHPTLFRYLKQSV